MLSLTVGWWLVVLVAWLCVVEQHSHGRRVPVVVLARPDRPEKRDQESTCDQNAEADEDNDYGHQSIPFLRAAARTAVVVNATIVMELRGISTAAIRGESVPWKANVSPAIL